MDTQRQICESRGVGGSPFRTYVVPGIASIVRYVGAGVVGDGDDHAGCGDENLSEIRESAGETVDKPVVFGRPRLASVVGSKHAEVGARKGIDRIVPDFKELDAVRHVGLAPGVPVVIGDVDPVPVAEVQAFAVAFKRRGIKMPGVGDEFPIGVYMRRREGNEQEQILFHVERSL